MLTVYSCVSTTFRYFKIWHASQNIQTSLALASLPEQTKEVVVATPEGNFPNRNASTYPYKSHGQWLRSAYAILGGPFLVLFNGWRLMLNPFSQADFLAAYMSLPIFSVTVVGYHIKDGR
jgi:amino acid transporter